MQEAGGLPSLRVYAIAPNEVIHSFSLSRVTSDLALHRTDVRSWP